MCVCVCVCVCIVVFRSIIHLISEKTSIFLLLYLSYLSSFLCLFLSPLFPICYIPPSPSLSCLSMCLFFLLYSFLNKKPFTKWPFFAQHLNYSFFFSAKDSINFVQDQTLSLSSNSVITLTRAKTESKIMDQTQPKVQIKLS